MTDQTSTTTAARRASLAEQITWQREAAILLGELLHLAARQHLPAINWTVANAGATLHGECITPHPQRREYFTTWRDAIAAVTTTGPDIDNEHVMASEEIRLLAKWERLPVDLNPRWREQRPGSRAPSVRVVLTANIWADDVDDERARASLLTGLDGEFRDYRPEPPTLAEAPFGTVAGDYDNEDEDESEPWRCPECRTLLRYSHSDGCSMADPGQVAPSPWGDRPEPEDPDRDRTEDAELADHQAHEPEPDDFVQDRHADLDPNADESEA